MNIITMHITVQQIIHDTCFIMMCVSLPLYLSKKKHMLLVVQMWFQWRPKHRVVQCHLGTWSTELEKRPWESLGCFPSISKPDVWGRRNRRCLGWSVFSVQKIAALSHEQMSNGWPIFTTKWRSNEQRGGVEHQPLEDVEFPTLWPWHFCWLQPWYCWSVVCFWYQLTGVNCTSQISRLQWISIYYNHKSYQFIHLNLRPIKWNQIPTKSIES